MTVQFETLLKTSAIFLILIFVHVPLINIEAMNDKKKKKLCPSGSDECSELYTVRREETRSESTSKESVLRQLFCYII